MRVCTPREVSDVLGPSVVAGTHAWTYVAQKLVERAQLGVLDDQVRVDLGGADALELHHVAVAQLAVPPPDSRETVTARG